MQDNDFAFINRKTEFSDLKNYIETKPNNLLFIYGPKSCGKSTLMMKVVESLDKKKYAVNFLDLRGVLIYDFKTFLQVFFPENLKGKVKDILGGITINTGFFGVKLEDEKMLKNNAFLIMENKLKAARKKGIKPVIIIDEIHLLKNIYINGERYLIDEIFNLFVRLTKVLHAANVICLTSDSYFVEEIFNNAKLSKTCNFYKIDHLAKEHVVDWLDNVEEIKFTKKQIEYVWKYLGGSPWEIWQVLADMENGKTLKYAVEKRLDVEDALLFSFRKRLKDKKLKRDFDSVSKVIAKQGVYKEIKNKDISDIVKLAVEQDIWFYDPSKKTVSANSKSIYWAMRK